MIRVTKFGCASHCVVVSLLTTLAVVVSPGASAADPAFTNSQVETMPLTSRAEALAGFHLPTGFHVTLFAGEPHVQQPIGMTFDARGRLWVAENYTYAESKVNFATDVHDRIVVFEDSNHDGEFDRRTVFFDKASKLTSVLVGFGGVYALCPPNLLFIPDDNGDDVPDGAPEIVLEGWDAAAVRHNIVNGLKLGPDGWIYGRHGILATSLVGRPGAPAAARVPLNCSIWRFHPVTKAFEVVAEGTTNPWGHDWDQHGQLFFINTVIGHLWHVVPGAYYKRMYGEHARPGLYELIDQTADHFHWDTAEGWSDIRKLGVTATTSKAGGGHAHSGMMIYQGDNWPSQYRNAVFTINFHGRRLNCDRLERQGAGYVGRHTADFLTIDDPWFRGIDLLAGPDGGVYISDWSDLGECHDQDGIHRTSGRIYKVAHGTPVQPRHADLSQLDSGALVGLQFSPNEWTVRQARQVLQERAATGTNMAATVRLLRRYYQDKKATVDRLRALWALRAVGGASEAWLTQQLNDPDERIRCWAVQLLADDETISPVAGDALVACARKEKSGLVLAFLASTLRKTAGAQRAELGQALARHGEFANDTTLSHLIWYGVEPVVSRDDNAAIDLVEVGELPKLRRFIARRLGENLEKNSNVVQRLFQLLAARPDPVFQTDVLTGLNEALRGWRQARPPAAWATLAPTLTSSASESVRKLSQQLAVVFGDGRAVDELRSILVDKTADLELRRRALQSLVQSGAPDLLPVLRPLLAEPDLAPDAVRGLAALANPAATGLLLTNYSSLRPQMAKTEAVNALASRVASALHLLKAVEQGRISRREIGSFQVRLMRTLGDAEISERLDTLWPQWRGLSGDKFATYNRYKKMLSDDRLRTADLVQGRALFQQACASCHVLFGEGGKIGPDLTGADRRNLHYLLDNIIDPSAMVAADHRLSIVTLRDGRVINGILGAGSERTATIQTPTEQLIVERREIESVRGSELSLMPEGLLDAFTDDQVRDLIGYLSR